MRVEIPAYTDRWMMGDRYGEVVRQSVKVVNVGRDHFEARAVYAVKLDKSGKRVRVIAEDCREV